MYTDVIASQFDIPLQSLACFLKGLSEALINEQLTKPPWIHSFLSFQYSAKETKRVVILVLWIIF